MIQLKVTMTLIQKQTNLQKNKKLNIFKLKYVLNLKITMHCVLCEKIIKGDVFCGYDKSFCTEKHRNMFINSNQELLKAYPYPYNIKNLLTIKIKTQPETVNCEKLTNPTENDNKW